MTLATTILLLQMRREQKPAIKRVVIRQCEKMEAVRFIRAHHSRLPKVQESPWQFAFGAYLDGVMVAAALWHNPSARTLPGHWLELRRMACSDTAPPCTASKMLGHMTRYFKRHCPNREKCVSYQDVEVHSGTIYRAANWWPEFFSRPRLRDRSKPRVGTTRAYRSDINTQKVASAGKIRWAFWLSGKPAQCDLALLAKGVRQSEEGCRGKTK